MADRECPLVVVASGPYVARPTSSGADHRFRTGLIAECSVLSCTLDKLGKVILFRPALHLLRRLVGAENLCHLAGCSADRWLLGRASGTCQAGLGLPGRGMIFGLQA